MQPIINKISDDVIEITTQSSTQYVKSELESQKKEFEDNIASLQDQINQITELKDAVQKKLDLFN